MAEVQRYESMVPMRYIVLQGKGHGPVLVRSPGLTTATCLQCEWHGFDRGALPSSDGLIEADGELHLQDVEDAERVLANEAQGLALAEMLLHASRATEAKVLADLRAKVERAILGEPCAEHGKAACIQTPTCRVEWAQKRLSRDIVRDLIGEVSE